MLRNVLSSVTTIDVTPAYADAVEALLPEALRLAERETYDREHGQKTYQTALISYASPGTGATAWAVYDADGATQELEEFDTRQEADERYEEMVRARAASLGYDDDGEKETFTASDVDGAPVAG
ncbi:hypothetical protein GCM10017673_38160 [Streptosporangium violaceochromogenes]|nr:hypothetical protein GCM10017673_38160 [Streptosporangium violaceochromogenes]